MSCDNRQQPAPLATQGLGECLDLAGRKELSEDLEARTVLMANQQPEWDETMMGGRACGCVLVWEVPACMRVCVCVFAHARLRAYV